MIWEFYDLPTFIHAFASLLVVYSKAAAVPDFLMVHRLWTPFYARLYLFRFLCFISKPSNLETAFSEFFLKFILWLHF